MKRFNLYSLYIALYAIVAIALAGCTIEDLPPIVDDEGGNGGGWTEESVGGDQKPGEDDGKEPGDDNTEPGDEPIEVPSENWTSDELAWVFDMNVLPEIHISVTESQWNELLQAYDRNSQTTHYIH